MYIKFFCSILLFTFQWAEPGGIGSWRGWLTIVLQCYDTVGLVIWPAECQAANVLQWRRLSPSLIYLQPVFCWYAEAHQWLDVQYINCSRRQVIHWSVKNVLRCPLKLMFQIAQHDFCRQTVPNDKCGVERTSWSVSVVSTLSVYSGQSRDIVVA